jgi:hypothetical protein
MSEIVRTKSKGLTKAERKKAEALKPAGFKQVTEHQLTDQDKIQLLLAALAKEENNRSLDERELIEAQSEFTLNMAYQAMELNRQLDERHNQKVSELEQWQNAVVNQFNSFVNSSNARHEKFCKALGTTPPEVVALIEEAFGSQDPND